MNITGKTVPWPSLQSFPRGSHSHEFVCKIFLLQQHDRLFPQLLFLIKKFCSLTCSRTFSSPGPCAQPCSWHREEMQSQPHPLESGFSFGCGCPNPHWKAEFASCLHCRAPHLCTGSLWTHVRGLLTKSYSHTSQKPPLWVLPAFPVPFLCLWPLHGLKRHIWLIHQLCRSPLGPRLASPFLNSVPNSRSHCLVRRREPAQSQQSLPSLSHFLTFPPKSFSVSTNVPWPPGVINHKGEGEWESCLFVAVMES